MNQDINHVYFRINPSDTNYVNRILEGYEYIGVMSTVDKTKGIAVVRTTADTKPLAMQVLNTLPEVLEILPLDTTQD